MSAIIFFPRISFLCWLLFRYPFHPRVTAVAREKILVNLWNLQVAGYSETYMHPAYVALHEVKVSTGAWLYGVHETCAETAAVSRGTSHVTAK